ncbi:hypothetical protein HYZ98_03645 [Candidatus Peregrinibacteria bacterium]|nr:hypothetical protein [Candidatus Peregrinibacteria bacterium]
MNFKSGIFSRWAERRVPPHSMAILRILLGMWLLIHWGLKTPAIPMLFSDQGLALPYFLPTGIGAIDIFLIPPSVTVAYAVFTLLMVALAMVTIGMRMRAGILMTLGIYAYFWNIGLHPFFMTFERLFVFILLVLLCSGADRTFSLRMLLHKGSVFAWQPIHILPQRLIALQLSATYLGVGWEKMALPDWQHGEILTHALTGRWATPLAFTVAQTNLPLPFYDRALFLLKFFQFLLPFGLWIRRYQWLFFFGGALFHITIAVLISMWWFLIMVPAYITFLEPEAVYRFLKKTAPSIP